MPYHQSSKLARKSRALRDCIRAGRARFLRNVPENLHAAGGEAVFKLPRPRRSRAHRTVTLYRAASPPSRGLRTSPERLATHTRSPGSALEPSTRTEHAAPGPLKGCHAKPPVHSLSFEGNRSGQLEQAFEGSQDFVTRAGIGKEHRYRLARCRHNEPAE